MTKSFLNATGQDLGAPFLSFRFQGRHGLDWNPGRAASGWGGAPGLVAYVPQCCPWAQGAEGEDAWPSSPGRTEDDFSPVKHLHIPSSPSCVRARVSEQGVQSLWGLGAARGCRAVALLRSHCGLSHAGPRHAHPQTELELKPAPH